MARQVEEIQAAIIEQVANTTDLSYVDAGGITRNITYNDSKRAKWRLWTFITAAAIAILEQLIDVFKSETETALSKAPAASTLWIQKRMFDFQYSPDVPQYVQLNEVTGVLAYPIIDATKKIITACSVVSGLNNTVLIKVAKGSPFTALDGSEITAAQDYIDTVGTAGITYNVTSLLPDRLFLQADVYYKGQYSAVISTNVVAALNAYLQGLSITDFNSSIKVTDIEKTILAVDGVIDVVVVKAVLRKESEIYGFGAVLVDGKTIINRAWTPAAGYAIGEDDSGHTFSDSLNFIAQ